MLRPRTFLISLLVLPLAILVAACGGSNDSNNLNPNAPTPPKGPADLQIIDINVGDGDTLQTGFQGTFNYTLWHYDPAGADSKGAAVQSNVIQFRPGMSNIIAGVSQGVVGMQVHGKRRLIIPPSLAYGAFGSSDGSIAPNEWVVFEFELIEVRDCSVSTCNS